ncbi:MAG: hypothetical protein AAF563_23025 [Pseudomonadota bacterium]
MRFKHDPLRPQPRRKKKNETSDETEQRLSADLRLLMTDERYQKNDPDYRHFVQRQYRRVYDDPSGEPREGLRIGRPEVFVTYLEPFDRDRERRIRRGEEVERHVTQDRRPSTTVSQSELGLANAGSARRQASGNAETIDEPDVIPYWERAIGQSGPNERTRSTPFPGIRDVRDEDTLRRYQDHLDEQKERANDVADARRRSWVFIQSASASGYDEAARAHEHYLEGSGEPLIVDSEIVRSYGPVNDAEKDILTHLKDWLRGTLSDSRFGQPWLDLANGERTIVGKESFDADRVGGLVNWNTTFDGPNSKLDPEFWTDARMTFNSGTLDSFSQLVFERHGTRIKVNGFVNLRVSDRYDFEDGHILESKVLEDHGDAKSFDISTTVWTRPISGWIELGGSQTPRVELIYDD